MGKLFPGDRTSKLLSVVGAVFITFALSVNLSARSGSWSGPYAFLEDFTLSVKAFDISQVFLAFMLYFLLLYCIGILKEAENIIREFVCAGIPALLFGVFMPIGYSFKTKGSYTLVFGNPVQLLKSGIYGMGYAALFFCGILLLFRFWDRIDIYKQPAQKHGKWIKKYLNHFEKKPFAISFLTMLLCCFPYMILSYPGILMGDAYSQITQAYNLESYNAYFNLLSEDVKINNHHPVTHTMFLHLCLRIGELFQNHNVGLGLYSVLQTMLVLVTFAWIIKVLAELGVSQKIRIILMLYFVLHPRISAFMFLVSKDILFTAFLMMFFLLLYQILSDKENRKNYYSLVGSILGVMLFRNDGIYLVLFTVVIVALVYKKYRRKFLALAGIILVFGFFWNSILLPILQIPPGGRREMLSLPMQQTARYVRDAGDEVTAAEKEAIDKVMVYDTLAEKYNPAQSDPVKATFREKTVTTEELINYFKVWVKMFFKHPEIYIQATLHNKYDMFYFDAASAINYSYGWSEECMEMLNGLSDELLYIQLNYSESLDFFRNWYESLREGLFSLPLLNLLLNSAVYINLFVVWIFYGIRKNSKQIVTLGVPMMVQLLIIIAGPCRANYFRYVYPLAVLLPVMILLGLHRCRQEESTKEVACERL